MADQLQRKVALVTGANKGLGLEMSRQLGKADITVVVGARDLAKAQQAVSELQAAGIDARPLALNVTDSASIEAAVKQIEDTLGRLDILVNNAGVMLEHDWIGNTALTVSPDTLRQTFDANFFGLVAVTQAFLPLIRKSEQGRIVNMSSIQGSLTLQADPQSPVYDSKPFAYDASKVAVNAFTVHLAHALRESQIKVNSAHPGWVQTELGGGQAPMSLEDGAKTGVQLATLPADGPSGAYLHFSEPLPW